MSAAAPALERRVLFHAFQPFDPPHNPATWQQDSELFRLARLAEEVQALAAGTALLVAIVERDLIEGNFEEEEEGRPDAAVLSPSATGTALRMAVVASRLLAERATETYTDAIKCREYLASQTAKATKAAGGAA